MKTFESIRGYGEQENPLNENLEKIFLTKVESALMKKSSELRENEQYVIKDVRKAMEKNGDLVLEIDVSGRELYQGMEATLYLSSNPENRKMMEILEEIQNNFERSRQTAH